MYYGSTLCCYHYLVLVNTTPMLRGRYCIEQKIIGITVELLSTKMWSVAEP